MLWFKNMFQKQLVYVSILKHADIPSYSILPVTRGHRESQGYLLGESQGHPEATRAAIMDSEDHQIDSYASPRHWLGQVKKGHPLWFELGQMIQQKYRIESPKNGDWIDWIQEIWINLGFDTAKVSFLPMRIEIFASKHHPDPWFSSLRPQHLLPM